MATKRIDTLDLATSVASDDRLLLTDVSDTTESANGTLKQVTSEVLFQSMGFDSWKEFTNTITRTGDHTFTVSGDVTAILREGMAIRYRDGGSDEYQIMGVVEYNAPNTEVTCITNNEYAMAAATITDVYITSDMSAPGLPSEWTWTPTYGGYSVNPTGGTYRWHIIGERYIGLDFGENNGTSNSTSTTHSLPVKAFGTRAQSGQATALITNNGTNEYGNGYGGTATNDTVVTWRRNGSSAGWTNSGNKRIGVAQFDYIFGT